MVKNLPAMQETRFDPGLGRFPGERNGSQDCVANIWSPKTEMKLTSLGVYPTR